jgi:hypothetical protein
LRLVRPAFVRCGAESVKALGVGVHADVLAPPCRRGRRRSDLFALHIRRFSAYIEIAAVKSGYGDKRSSE